MPLALHVGLRVCSVSRKKALRVNIFCVVANLNRLEYARLACVLSRERQNIAPPIARVVPMLERESVAQQTENVYEVFPPIRRRRWQLAIANWQSTPANLPSSPEILYDDGATNVRPQDITDGHALVNIFIDNEQLPLNVHVEQIRSDVYRLYDFRV